MQKKPSNGWILGCVRNNLDRPHYLVLFCAGWLVYFVWWRNLSLPAVPIGIVDQQAGVVASTWEQAMEEAYNVRMKWGILVLVGFLGLLAVTMVVRPWRTQSRSYIDDGGAPKAEEGQLPVVRESTPTTNGEAVDVDAQESCS